MIKRRSRAYIANLLEENPNWNVLDLGGGTDAWKQANTILDFEDHSRHYKDRKFIKGEATNTPFKDKEFDFVICSHVIEHIVNPEQICKELERISHAGYIEFPTPFFDNLVHGNDGKLPHGHIWWVRVDDDEECLSFKPKARVIAPQLYPQHLTPMTPFFAQEIQTGVYWESDIPFRIDPPKFSWTSNNTTGVVTQDLSDRLIYVDSGCGRFINYPVIKRKK